MTIVLFKRIVITASFSDRELWYDEYIEGSIEHKQWYLFNISIVDRYAGDFTYKGLQIILLNFSLIIGVAPCSYQG